MTDLDALGPVQAAYGPEEYARLVGIRTRFDPNNVFHRDTNIVPARS